MWPTFQEIKPNIYKTLLNIILVNYFNYLQLIPVSVKKVGEPLRNKTFLKRLVYKYNRMYFKFNRLKCNSVSWHVFTSRIKLRMMNTAGEVVRLTGYTQ